MTDHETTFRVTDPNNGGGTISVRALFTLDSGEATVYGVFRLSDDSEIAFDSLDFDDQARLLNHCESDSQRKQK